jgi:hypothetical protein
MSYPLLNLTPSIFSGPEFSVMVDMYTHLDHFSTQVSLSKPTSTELRLVALCFCPHTVLVPLCFGTDPLLYMKSQCTTPHLLRETFLFASVIS